MPDVLIIGGGVTGLSAAWELARAGQSVTLLESRRLGAMASTWTLGGCRQSGRHPFELPLALAALKRWPELERELGAPTGFRQQGNIRLARTKSEIPVIRKLVADQRAAGLDIDFLPDLKAVRAVAPAIGESVLAASFCPGDGHADPDMTVAAFAAAARRHGAEIREGVRVVAVETRGAHVTGVRTADGATISADRIVVAAGIHSPELLAPLGLALPLSVKRVCVLRTVPAPPSFAQVFGVANADAAGRQEISGHFRITTGIGDFPGSPAHWTVESLQPPLADIAALITRGVTILPMLADLGVDRVWGGLIDLTPDALPAIDAATGVDGLIVAAGFSGHGFGIAPVTGEILCDLVLGKAPAFDLAPFRLSRFKGMSGTGSLTLHG